MKTPVARFLAGTTLLAAGLLAGLVLSVQLDLGPGVARTNEAMADAQTAILPGGESPFVAVADRVVPAVVAISTRRGADDGEATFHPWGDMFEDLFPDQPRRERPRGRRPQGSGSGFIIDGRGYVMTNNHVVASAEAVTVRLSDGSELAAEIVGQDPATDVAVLKVDPDDYEGGALPILELGDSESIRVGDWAIAIGNPFGQLAGTLTVGVISAKGRADLNIMGGTPAYQNFIQTDASINFGNSGGPLVNIKGNAIGMNTAINPAGQGIGFAIPINLASKIAEELIKEGKVTRGYLGILPQELTPEIAESFDVAGTEGILIAQVVEDTPAERGGLRTGDIITRMNGNDVSDVNRFRMLVAETGVGEELVLDVLRDGRERTFRITLDERPGTFVASSGPAEPEEWAGLAVVDLDSREGRRLVDDPEEEGVVVVNVEYDSPADDAGIQVGDVIKEVGNVEISGIRDYEQALEKYEGKNAVAILVKRGNQTLYVGLKP